MPEGTPEGQETEGTESKSFDESYVKELRSEAAKYRTERNELKKQVEALAAKDKEREDSGKSEVEKLAGRIAALEAEKVTLEKAAREKDMRAMVVSEAAKMNVVDSDAVYRLLDLDGVEELADIKKALTVLLKEKPFLIKEEGPPSPGAGGQKPPSGSKKSTDQQLVDMLKAGAQKKRLL
jgi:seryl-tRNA synthetase